MTLLLPKLRSHFAEFLNRSYLVHLRILSPSTCVGLRYGQLDSLTNYEDFLGSMIIASSFLLKEIPIQTSVL